MKKVSVVYSLIFLPYSTSFETVHEPDCAATGRTDKQSHSNMPASVCFMGHLRAKRGATDYIASRRRLAEILAIPRKAACGLGQDSGFALSGDLFLEKGHDDVAAHHDGLDLFLVEVGFCFFGDIVGFQHF